MNEGLIPSRYAKALHLYAEEAGKAAAVYEQTERLAAGYEAHPQMSRAVENPFLPLADKQQLLLVASGAENDGCLDKFFQTRFQPWTGILHTLNGTGLRQALSRCQQDFTG